MKKFEVSLESASLDNGWSIDDNSKKIELLKCIFYATDLAAAERFKSILEQNYRIPNQIVAQSFKVKEVQ